MPINGHPPGMDPGFRSKICAACRAGDHPNCRPLIQQSRVYHCECLGPIRPDAPTCLPEEHP